LRKELFKIGAKVVRHRRYVAFQYAGAQYKWTRLAAAGVALVPTGNAMMLAKLKPAERARPGIPPQAGKTLSSLR
jgi:hypothetical protein